MYSSLSEETLEAETTDVAMQSKSANAGAKQINQHTNGRRQVLLT